MGSFYDKLRNTGLRLLKKRGVAVTLRREQQGDYDPDTGTTATATVTDYACVGLISNIDSEAANQFYSTSTLRNSLIEKQDKMIILSALLLNGETLSITPNPITDTLILKGVEYDVVAIVPLEPDGDAILYSIQVRK